MDELCQRIQKMRIDKGWDKTDTDPILAKSIVIEAAELLECYQWDEEHVDKEAVKSELADVLMYTISLCMDNGWDYKQVVYDKFDDVNRRYPDKDAI